MPNVKRVGSVIRLRSEGIAEYEQHHAAVWPGVLEQLSRSQIRNYSIYRFDDVLFSYFEYVGTDYEADMAAMAADPVTQDWWAVVNPLQSPIGDLPPGTWRELPEVFHHE